MGKGFSKGKANRRTLADRMKTIEDVTTSATLMERLPIYARLDMRAGHTFCRGLDKPFDATYSAVMKETTAKLVEKTGALLGFCQSDEISLVYADSMKLPFGTRLFKLESVLASMCTSFFVLAGMKTKLKDRIEKWPPSFDCRVMNMPDLNEAANAILWRQRDSVKNSITLLALESFSTKQLDKKSGEDKIRMLAEKGIDYWTALGEDERLGSFFRRELWNKPLSDEELARIPVRNWPAAGPDGRRTVVRSRISQFRFGAQLDNVENRVGALFSSEPPVIKGSAAVLDAED